MSSAVSDVWERFAGSPVELIVVEDGCRDHTAQLSRNGRDTVGKWILRWIHGDNVHELRATNRGFREARAPLVMSWHDDMFLCADWLVPELLPTFDRYRTWLAVPEPRPAMPSRRRAHHHVGGAD